MAPPTAGVSVADDVLKKLDPRSIDVERIAGWITAVVFGLGLQVGIAVAFFVALESRWWALPLLLGWVLAVGGLAWMAERYPYLDYERTRYRVSPLGIEIRRGVWWRRVINVPRSRVQHTDVAQGPVQRAFGIATLVIYTAGTHNASVSLGGLSHETALAIRDHLIVGGQDDAV